MELIHGHEIIELAKNNDYSKEELKKAVLEKFGKEAKFTKCCNNTFSYDEITAFLFENKKLVEKEGKVKVNEVNVCNH